MFLTTLPSTKTPITPKTLTIPLTFFFTHSTSPSHHEQPQNQLDQIISIDNTPHWTKTIHDLCTRHRNVDQALHLLDHLRLRGYRPNPLNLCSIIHALCDSNRFEEAHHRFAHSIDSDCVPDQRTCNVIIARLLDLETPHSTLGVLRVLGLLKPDFVASLVNYNRLMDQLCSLRRPSEAHRVLFDMLIRGHCPNAVSYTTLINGYCGVGELGNAHKVFDEMCERGVAPNSMTYSVLIRGVLRKRDIGGAMELMGRLWDTMKGEDDTLVKNAAFSNLIDSMCREGYFQEVFGIAEYRPQGESVNEEFAYGQMIDSLCKAGRHHGASRIVYIMRHRGFVPRITSYNCIIHGLSKEGEGGCMRAYQLLEEGIEFGYLPSEYTYKVLVEGLCQESDVDKARQVLQYMLKKERVDKTRMYNIYLRALCLVNNTTELLNVLVSMLQTECQPDVITLNIVVNGFCKMGRVEEALKVLDDMMTGKFCAPNVVTFTTIINGLLNVGKTQEALGMLHDVMPQKGFPPNVVTYNAVLRGLFKLNQGREAMEIFNGMVTEGVAADSTTYTIIIDGLCESDQLEEAKRFWDEVIWPSQIHDNFVYAAIIKGICHSGNFDEACHFLYELVDSGVSPNIFSYNIVIDTAYKLGLKKEAYEVVREMRRNGLAPDSVTWRILDKLHGNSRKQYGDDEASTLQFGSGRMDR
ncbi:pentatricopeptide repeat-containing protein At3g18020 [Rosa rugosa]|uniref:pentatricopeptide repeat-containing protein At3g18020 n=1 Tax=Rosa rugosa TaxID=74645 RepID=UPI002B402E29|nr:pentatricopeptide repeat-containing protein At3g18020 [Rosa rugosa]